MLRMTHKPSGAEGEDKDGMKAFSKMIDDVKYQDWHRREMMLRQRKYGRHSFGIMFSKEQLMQRAETIIKLGLETGAIMVESTNEPSTRV